MPDIPPIVPMAMIMLAITPTLYTLWKTPNAIIFVKAITFCSLCRYRLSKPQLQSMPFDLFKHRVSDYS